MILADVVPGSASLKGGQGSAVAVGGPLPLALGRSLCARHLKEAVACCEGGTGNKAAAQLQDCWAGGGSRSVLVMTVCGLDSV